MPQVYALGHPGNDPDGQLLRRASCLEQKAHGDLLLLDIRENIHHGKLW